MARSIKLVLHVLYIILLSYFICRLPKKRYVVKKMTRFQHDMKHLLLWTNIPGFDEEGQNVFINKQCLYKNCYVSQNRSLFRDLRYFDAILFNAKDLSEKYMDLPAVRAAAQKYIFVANESADNYPICSSVYDNYFNWTWTYRTDSTISYKYFAVKNLYNEDLDKGFDQHTDVSINVNKRPKSLFYAKSKAAVIFMDNCETRSNREGFIAELKNHLAKYKLTVDVLGKCGKNCRKKTMMPCFWKLRRDYFFYLALEDSMAEDYITEQIVYGYKYHAVPIVFGGADYQSYLPKNSYINAMQMNQETLAKTMNDIIQNRTRYTEYFKWKNHYTITDCKVLDPCSLCRTLNYVPWINLKVSYVLLRKWWNNDFKKRCNGHWRMDFF